MPTFVHLPSGNWRAVIRRKGRYVAETFRRKLDAEPSWLKNGRSTWSAAPTSARM